MKFLIAGFGSIGRRHFNNLLTLGERDIIFYRTGQSTLPDEEIADFIIERDLDAALAHKPDAVIVSNPTALHLDIAIPAAQTGCHLLLEKPISHSMARIDQLQASMDKGGGKALVGFQFRFHPGLQSIRSLLMEGAIGRATSVRAHWGEYLPAWHPWEDYRKGYSARSELGGGVILTLCHPLDYLRWILGEVATCWAFAGHGSGLNIDVEDTAEIGLHFSSGLTGTVHLDFVQQPASHHLEIVGTQGTIRWDNGSGAVTVYRASQTRESAEDKLWQIYNLPQGFERNDMFLALMEHFIAVVRGNEEPLCTLGDGIQALRIALAAMESATKGFLITI